MPKRFFVTIWEKTKYELPVFLLLCVQLATQRTDVNTDAYRGLLVLDYGDAGFAPRLFIGSVLSLFMKNKSAQNLNAFLFALYIAAFVFVSLIAGALVRKTAGDSQKMTVFLLALFFASPFSAAVFLPRFFSLDRLQALFALFAMLLVNKRGFRWLVPAALFMALATHHSFGFMFMPAVAIAVLYETGKSGFKKNAVLFGAACFLTMAAVSAYFYLYDGSGTFADIDEMNRVILSKSDINNTNESIIQGYFLMSPAQLLESTKAYYLNRKMLTRELWENLRAGVYLLPAAAVFYAIWIAALKEEKEKFGKFILWLCMLAPLARLPLIILSTDSFRGRSGWVFVQFCLLFYFIVHRHPAVSRAAEKVWAFFVRQPVFAVLIVSFYASLSAAYPMKPEFRTLFKELYWLP